MSAVTHTRGKNSIKLLKHNIVNFRDANCVTNTWNKLSDSIVLAPSISCFKRQLSTFVCNVSYDYFFTQ